MDNTEILSKVILSFLRLLSNKTSQDFTIKTFDYILEKHKSVYKFLKLISIGKNPLDQSIIIDVESTSDLKYADLNEISDFFEIVFKEVFKEVIRDERYYSTDLDLIMQELEKDVGDLLEELGIKIQWRLIVEGAHAELHISSVDISLDDKYSKKSQALEPLLNSIVGLVFDGMLKKEKKRKDAVEVVVETIRKLEKKYDFFRYMLLEDIEKDKTDYGVKTQWTIQDIFFFDSSDTYAIKAVSKIDKVDDENYAKAMTEFILEVGSYINVQDKPYFIAKLKNGMGKKNLEKFIDIGIDLDEIDENFKKQGYNDIIKRTFKALIDIIGHKTSNSFGVAILDKLIDDMKKMENTDLLNHITVDKSLYDYGVEAIKIDLKINNENPYIISKFLTYILKKIQENRDSYAEKASFIKDIQREMGDRYFAELDNMGVNVHLIDMRFI